MRNRQKPKRVVELNEPKLEEPIDSDLAH
jgi:hypothetical protein